ncbi:hypothetical protein C8T65DRAFT_694969 [Cerioporus squamosus]|nr:hypothetical protein C8T65DRAFT_694969 [Cerioporus squamosus]
MPSVLIRTYAWLLAIAGILLDARHVGHTNLSLYPSPSSSTRPTRRPCTQDVPHSFATAWLCLTDDPESGTGYLSATRITTAQSSIHTSPGSSLPGQVEHVLFLMRNLQGCFRGSYTSLTRTASFGNAGQLQFTFELANSHKAGAQRGSGLLGMYVEPARMKCGQTDRHSVFQQNIHTMRSARSAVPSLWLRARTSWNPIYEPISALRSNSRLVGTKISPPNDKSANLKNATTAHPYPGYREAACLPLPHSTTLRDPPNPARTPPNPRKLFSQWTTAAVTDRSHSGTRKDHPVEQDILP